MTKSYKYQRVTAAHTTQLAEIAEREGAGGWRLVYVFHNGSSGPHQFEALLELEVVPGPALSPRRLGTKRKHPAEVWRPP